MVISLPGKTNTYGTILRKATSCEIPSWTNGDPSRSSAPVKAKDIYFTGLGRRRVKKATLHVWVGIRAYEPIAMETSTRIHRYYDKRDTIIRSVFCQIYTEATLGTTS